jgi:mannose-6-phosphate isomerase-like protein (cupin superfamily)
MAEAQVIDYQRPVLKDGQPKAVKMLARSDRAFFAVQLVAEGGENNLHSHAHVDGFWFVLKGRARFYTTGDEVIKEAGPLEGVLVPRGYPYWFESCGEEELEILQFEASDEVLGKPNEDRTDFAPQKEWMNFGDKKQSA